ncbi:MAG: response regulator transcription factor [Labilithrix sp.]|nr:response regulator transcription factor [Labilithrix sp.]MCW5837262.1 response regulator transcription factor [Labilithrix sp.]
MRLLLVEDSHELASALADGLERAGFVVDTCADGESALELAESRPYVGIILDRMLPAADGLDVCRALRAKGSSTPILVLTARDALEDRVEGLDAGADDYLVKPFAFAELLARTRAITRRQAARRSNVLRAGELTLDLTSGDVRWGEREIAISVKERAILTALLRHPGRVLTYGHLVEQGWNLDAEPSPEVVRAHVKNLRRKLAEHGAAGLIETVHGLGYRVAG